jgi:ABC-type glutathione transport system ATPase component
MAPVISLAFYFLMLLWSWPIANRKDGSKVSLCYCLKPRKGQEINELAIPVSEILQEDEMKLV